MRVAMCTHTDVGSLLRAPYARTLWTYYHLLQRERIEDIHQQARALHQAGLMTLAFHEPRRLSDEHRRLLHAAGLTVSPDTSRAQALAFVAEIDRADAAGAWVPMSPTEVS